VKPIYLKWGGKSYEHRRCWIEKCIRELAGVFAIDVAAYAVMRQSLSYCLTGISLSKLPEPFKMSALGIGYAVGRDEKIIGDNKLSLMASQKKVRPTFL